MAQALNYEPPSARPSRALGRAAGLAAAYPLLLLGALYGQWLLSWWVLGHEPRPSLDDPKFIDGASWMHLVTYVALRGLLPVGAGALALNVIYIALRRPSLAAALLRIGLIVPLWVGTLLLIRYDPGRVLYWWRD